MRPFGSRSKRWQGAIDAVAVGMLLTGMIACGGSDAEKVQVTSADSVFGDAPTIDSATPDVGLPTVVDTSKRVAPPPQPPQTAGEGATISTLPRTSPPPVTAGGAIAEVRFETTPAGATVVLRGKETFTGTTPYAAKVPAGTYTWSVSKEGFLPDSSGAGGLQLVSTSRTVSVQLMNANDWSGIADKADAAFKAGNCEQAVPLYRTLDKPKERTSRLYERWMLTRMQLGRCSQRLNDPAGAVDALRAVRDDNPTGPNWRVVYELGIAQCSNLSFTEGRRTFGELDGQIRNRVATENRPALRALAYYGRAFCGFQDFESRTGTPPQALVSAIQDDFERFFRSAEAAREQGAMTKDINDLLSEVIGDAETLRKRLPNQ